MKISISKKKKKKKKKRKRKKKKEKNGWKGLRCTVLFFKIKFSVPFEESSLQRCNFQISVEMVKSRLDVGPGGALT